MEDSRPLLSGQTALSAVRQAKRPVFGAEIFLDSVVKDGRYTIDREAISDHRR
jgi:hypothetical protein